MRSSVVVLAVFIFYMAFLFSSEIHVLRNRVEALESNTHGLLRIVDLLQRANAERSQPTSERREEPQHKSEPK